MKKTTEFLMNADRYQFDFGECSTSEGWAQLDTNQDAWYYGAWANPFDLKSVHYAEGDLTRITFDSIEEFVKEIRLFADADYFIGVDPGLKPEHKARWKEIGLTDLLH